MVRRVKGKQRFLGFSANLVEVARSARNEARDIELVHLPIHLSELPQQFEGYTIAQLSDIHHGTFVQAEHIRSAVEIVNRLKPDLIVLTGDYVTYSRAYIDPCAELLGDLRAEDGVFAVLGNHDYWADAEQTTRALQRKKISMLRNVHTQLRRDGDCLTLVGVDDSTVQQADLARALRGVPPSASSILLSHNPNLIRQASQVGIDLMLAGHTHGGQIRLSPRRRQSRRIGRLWRGHGQVGRTQIYVNRGLGTVIVPVRYQCAPEITLIELNRRSPDTNLSVSDTPRSDEATANLG